MGYMVLLQSFADGGEGAVPLYPVLQTLRRYGDVSPGWEGQLELKRADLGEHIGLHTKATALSGITISRPCKHVQFRPLIFDLVNQHALVFFTQECDHFWAGRNLHAELPRDLQYFPFTIVTEPSEIWPDAV
jgi:hypothetical protein